MTNSSNMKFGIKLSPQHFPVGTQFKKSSSPFGKDDPNYDKILTATGYSYNGPCSFVIHYEGEEFIKGLHNLVNSYWVTEIVKRGDGPVEVSKYHSTYNWRNAYVEEALRFVYAPKTHHWDGIDSHVCLKTNYLFFTYHDIIYMMLDVCKKDPSEFYDIDAIEEAIRNSPNAGFIKVLRGNISIHPSGCKTVIGYTANKKRFNRWFKQNINRFKKSVKIAKTEYYARMDGDDVREYKNDFISPSVELDGGADDERFALPA